MVLSPIEYCRISSFLPRMEDALKELHPKELIELPDIFAGIVIPFICLYLQCGKFIIILVSQRFGVNNDKSIIDGVLPKCFVCFILCVDVYLLLAWIS